MTEHMIKQDVAVGAGAISSEGLESQTVGSGVPRIPSDSWSSAPFAVQREAGHVWLRRGQGLNRKQETLMSAQTKGHTTKQRWLGGGQQRYKDLPT